MDFGTTVAVSDATSTLSTSPNGLSSGTKAGVGIGAAFALLAILGLVVYLVDRKRRRRSCPELLDEPLAKGDSTVALHELQDQSPVFHEVGDKDRLPVEIGSQNPIHELEARR